MRSESPYHAYAAAYDRWYDDNPHVYAEELQALQSVGCIIGPSLEVGVGTGRFAKPLKVDVGLDVSPAMLDLARQQGRNLVCGRGEALPFADHCLKTVLMVTVLCFLKKPEEVLAEIRRVLSNEGNLLIAFLNRESPLVRQYEQQKDESLFYREARFYTCDEVKQLLGGCGFEIVAAASALNDEETALSASQSKVQKSAFVAFRAKKERPDRDALFS